MAQFRATIEGQRGEASRLGSKASGITARINGWNGGVRVEAAHRDGKDYFDVYATGGSGHGDQFAAGYLGTVDDEGRWTPAKARQEAA